MFRPLSCKVEDEIARRWLVDPIEDGQDYPVRIPDNMTRAEVVAKIHKFTTGRFYTEGNIIQFAKEQDCVIFKLCAGT